MNRGQRTPRVLGAAVLLVFVASLLSEQLLEYSVGSGSISEMLVNISGNVQLMQISNLVALVNSLGIVALGVLFYFFLSEHNKVLALIALGCYLAEAVALAMSKIGSYGLITVSQEFLLAGSPRVSYFKTFRNFLYNSFVQQGYNMHMLFFCVGGILWYFLLYRARAVPPFLSIWGLAGICLLTFPVVCSLLDLDSLLVMVLGLPYAPFEFVLGIWLIVKGFNSPPIAPRSL